MIKKSISTPIRIWLRDAAEQLAEVGISSALLDAEIILSHTLRKSRTWLHAHSEELVSARELEIANARLDLRLDRTPIAYIIGHKEFYGRLFKVTPAVLIPRPESETIITLLTGVCDGSPKQLLDIGTGSGCLGITAKLEHPELEVILVDISQHALTIAEKNAESLGASVKIVRNNLLTTNPQLPANIDIVVANLPYVDRSWERSVETNAEPDIALFANKKGLALIERVLVEAASYLQDQLHILLEADPRQHESIIRHATALGYHHLASEGFCLVFRLTRSVDTREI
ncbi:MAG: peptide chain release factor N(5)-glutamine methyltransferase [Candidatus Saccharimonas sp.]|jgi:release factor glutamine methyltransferase|nr:peptide chain release factor N(5)-glutamine methyltransferase [Candidatus Saccharimonas sp.]